MPKKIFLIFPNQLFQDLPNELSECTVYLVEDSLFFGDKHHKAKFHKQKILLHRLSMNAYKQRLKKENIKASLLPYDKEKTICDVIKDKGWEDIITYDPVDYLLQKRLENSSADITFIPTQLFLNSKEDNQEYFGSQEKPKKSLKMQPFYVAQRKRLDILVTKDHKPKGGDWSYDEENRKKIPKREIENVPHIKKDFSHDNYESIKKSVAAEFPKNPGSLSEFIYPSTHTDAKAWFNDFLSNRFALFGDYEDAIVAQKNFLYHSLISPLINIGLLTPKYVIERALDYGDKNDIPLNTMEGFVRQIIGWREYMRGTYEIHSVKMRTKNHWNHKNALPKSFYDASTGLAPVDDTIQKALDSAYNHHIERLMILGNIMFLLEIDPDDIYKWFMEMYIDSYDWVMVPNVYSMSQNADGGLTTTKPYFSGSNYIKKMSNYTVSSNDRWSEVWDGLYWGFIKKHHKELSKNHRWSMMVNLYKKDPDKYKQRITKANKCKKELLK